MNTKKIVCGMIVAVIAMSYCVTNAQKTDTKEEISDISVTQDVMSSVSPAAMDDIYKIVLHYCNEEIQWNKTNTYLTIMMRPWQMKNLCITWVNNSENHQDLTMGFTESIFNDAGKQLCNGDLADQENDFYKLINLKETEVWLSGNGGTSTQTAKISMPKNATGGEIYWCIGFFLSGSYFKWPNDVLGVRVARHFPMKIIVTWDVYNFGWRDDIKDVYTTNRNVLLKIIIAILAIRLIMTIIKTTDKKDKQHNKHTSKK